ncbi:hypothetical protein LguiA_007070 [Lonicera macranthoides]
MYNISLIAILEPLHHANKIQEFSNRIGFHFSLANQEADEKIWLCWNYEVNVVLVDAFEQCITVDISFLDSDLGDFNAISDVSEKVGGRPPKIQDLESFNAMINDCGIVDCDYEGNKYTWLNNQEWGLCSVSFDPLADFYFDLLGPALADVVLGSEVRLLSIRTWWDGILQAKL